MKLDTSPAIIYEIYMMLEQEDGSYKKSYEDIILAKDEESAVYQWAEKHNISGTSICQSLSGDWNWFGDEIVIRIPKIEINANDIWWS